jgi:hypothetical protein
MGKKTPFLDSERCWILDARCWKIINNIYSIQYPETSPAAAGYLFVIFTTICRNPGPDRKCKGVNVITSAFYD